MTMTIIVRNRAAEPGYVLVENGPGPGLSVLYRSLLPLLHTLGDLLEVDANTDLQELCRSLRESGKEPFYCVFGLPDEAEVSVCCPVVAAIAWPFDVLPLDSPECWRERLLGCAGAITFSQQTARAIHQLMGERFAVLVSAAQPWERFGALCPREGAWPSLGPRVIHFSGQLLDSPSIGLSVDALARPEPIALPDLEPEPEAVIVEAESAVEIEAQPLSLQQRLYVTGALLRGWWREVTDADRHLRQQPAPGAVQEEPEPATDAPSSVSALPAEPQRITLYGVVYACVMRAEDETRCWTEMLTAFCRTFRDQPDVTLVFKFTHENLTSGRIGMLSNLSRLAPFKCRVVIMNGHLDEQQYQNLIAASHYLVHPAHSESSAITAQEFMSAGRPVIAPRHSALSDWLEPEHPLIIRSSRQPTHWAGDPDKRMRYQDHRLQWQSMCEVFQDSFDLATRGAAQYQALSARASARARDLASESRLQERWREFFTRLKGEPQVRQVSAQALRAGT